MIKKNLLIMALCGAFFLTGKAADLKAPIGLSSAKVLPQGVRNLSYKGLYTAPQDKFNTQGQNVSLGDPFFQEITFKNILDGKKDPAERGAIKQAMLAVGADEGDSFGQTTGVVNVEALAHIPVIAYGISDKWTSAVAIPIIRLSINVDAGVIQENQELHDKMVAFLKNKKVSSKVLEFNEDMAQPVTAKLEDYGYKPLEDKEETLLGDIKLVNKYQLLNSGLTRLSVVGEVTLPTGKDQDVDTVVDTTSGDGQTDIGVGVAYDVDLLASLTLSLGSTYTVQLADTNPERIPERVDSKLTPDVDYNTKRDLGDIWSSVIGLQYQYKFFYLGGAYSFQTKQRDQYEGGLYDQGRYYWLGEETQQRMHSAVLTIGMETISLYRQKAFPIPLSVAIAHGRILEGKNVVSDPSTTLDINFFF